MSKSKNIVDPESMIKIFGADAVRWFILSTALQKEMQWSTAGVSGIINLFKEYGTKSKVLNRKQGVS